MESLDGQKVARHLPQIAVGDVVNTREQEASRWSRLTLASTGQEPRFARPAAVRPAATGRRYSNGF
jgi:hypothetical protein